MKSKKDYRKAYRDRNPDKVRAWRKRYYLKKRALVVPEGPWTCPKCGKTVKATGKGGHRLHCGMESTRFWEKVVKAGSEACWQWTGSVTSHGYGNLTYKGKTLSAHQVAYKLCVGEVPAGLIIRHKCDNPLCCNPAHMELGTRLDNARDKSIRGRTPKSIVKRLTHEQILEIRAARGKLSSGDIMKKYGITRSYAFAIWARRVWSHV